MNIAVISCIHGNLAALEAVLQDIEQQRADQIFCLGDLVGYGPFPNEVVARIRALEIPTCQGCWDEDVIAGLNACECSYPSLLAEQRGRLAHEWTDREITPETRAFLADLPLSLRHENLCFVHGSPHSQHEYLLPQTQSFIALERVLASGADVLFCGHTHIPYVRELSGGEFTVRLAQALPRAAAPAPSLTVPLKRIVNAGSVGEPRHGSTAATYVLYDSDRQQVTLRQVDYDYRQTCAAIVEQGLPAIFAWRLAQGLEFAEKAEDAQHICER